MNISLYQLVEAINNYVRQPYCTRTCRLSPHSVIVLGSNYGNCKVKLTSAHGACFSTIVETAGVLL